MLLQALGLFGVNNTDPWPSPQTFYFRNRHGAQKLHFFKVLYKKLKYS